MTVPDEYLKIHTQAYERYPGDAYGAERDAFAAVFQRIEQQVHAGFAEADVLDLNALTANQLTSLVMNAIRGEPDA